MRLRNLLYITGFILPALLVAACSGGSSTDDDINNAIHSSNTSDYDEGDTGTPVSGNSIALTYYTYYGTKLPDPSYVTHVNYAFAELNVTNDVYQSFTVLGMSDHFMKLVELKKSHPSLKVLLSFHNTAGGGFSSMVKTDSGRKKFAQDCLSFLQTYGIDGVDLDWEFPGMSWSSTITYDVVNDVPNFTLLLKQLRETFGSQYLLSYAGYCMDKQSTTGGYRYIDIAASLPYVDYINIMTYDLSVSGGNFHSALEGATSAAYTCKGAVAAYAKVGAPYSKLLLGIPFYGRKDWGSALTYKTIVNLDKSVYNIDNWSTAQSVPYVTRVSNGEVLWGYDNPRSIAIKGSWAMGLGMRGLFSWECSQDDDNESLTKALYNAVMKK